MGTVRGMDTQSTPTAIGSIENLFKLTLFDGLKTISEGKTIKYMTVHLRETLVADERIAQRMAERVVLVGGVHKLLVSDADFQYAMTMRHIDAFECDGQKIPQPMIDLDLMGKLSPHDLGLIEQRIFLISLAAEVRYGNMTHADFDRIMAGGTPSQGGPTAPQRGGQAADVGQAPAQSRSGPALLADFVGVDTSGAPAGNGP
jgi:phage FluMu protein gp41